MEVESETLEELFREAARGMFSYLLPDKPILGKKTVEKKFELESVSLGTLLADFLNEFIFYFFSKKLVPLEIKIRGTGKFFLKGSAVLGGIGEEEFRNAREIKSAVYHGAEISKDRNFRARVIFDV